jgi:hypothetical protein
MALDNMIVEHLREAIALNERAMARAKKQLASADNNTDAVQWVMREMLDANNDAMRKINIAMRYIK